MASTTPWQPICYDMMLLAHALVKLTEFGEAGNSIKRKGAVPRAGTKDPRYCDKQTYFENALTKIRALAQFISGTGPNEYLRIDNPAFGGTCDSIFMKPHFSSVSVFLSHPNEQRYKKDGKTPRPKAADALDVGKEILDTLKPLMDAKKREFTGDLAHWYGVFEERYGDLCSLQAQSVLEQTETTK